MNTIRRKRNLTQVDKDVEQKKPKRKEICEEEDEDVESDNPILSLIKERERVDFEDNHIYFSTDVSEKSIGKLNRIINQINKDYNTLCNTCKLAKISPLPVFLHITSTGGECSMGYLAFDVIKNSQVPIYTICEGHVMSAGTIMSMAGTRRFITENSVMLIHQIRAFHGGTHAELKDHMFNSDVTMKQANTLYLKNTKGKLSKKELNRLLLKDIYLTSNECIKYGLVDEIFRGEHMIK